MPAISRQQMQKELVPGLNALFGLEYKQYPNEWKEIFKTETSERSFEEETKLSGFGMAYTTYEGEGVPWDIAQEAWTARYVVSTVKLGFQITEEAIEDNLYASLSQRYTKALARSMAITKEVKGAYVLNNAFATVTYGDGQFLCDTDHPLVNGGTNSNRPATGADFNETSLEAAIIQIAGWTDERGLLINAQARKLIIPVNLMFTAQRVLKTELRVGTANNDINAIKSMNVVPGGFSVNHWLTDTNAWFLITDVPDGLKHFQRIPLNTKSEGDFETGNMRYRARERYVFGATDPLGIYGSPGSS